MLPPWSRRGLHVIVKPIGAACNMRCRYCFYLEKASLYAQEDSQRIDEETLAVFIRQYLEAQPPGVAQVDFAFQGGEPTLLGLDFFRRVVELQRQLAAPGIRIHNSLQTNGLLLDDAWCSFLEENRFLVGLSLDGPGELHDSFRRDTSGRGTFDRVMESLERLTGHGVEFNVLCCVHRKNADQPQRVYRFFRKAGVRFLQFIPIVDFDEESLEETGGDQWPDELANPWTVLPEQYGRFLCGVFDLWIRDDVGRIFVRDFDQALAAWLGRPPDLCVYAPECGRALVLEHNGDLYSCDHFVDEAHRLGNIHQRPIAELANLPQQVSFGQRKQSDLPSECRRCQVRFACNGGCPKDRLVPSANGTSKRNYLCAGYRAFFSHIAPYMQRMADLVRSGRPAAHIMQLLAQQEQSRPLRKTRRKSKPNAKAPGRNDPCPCGSGRKYKRCCGRR